MHELYHKQSTILPVESEGEIQAQIDKGRKAIRSQHHATNDPLEKIKQVVLEWGHVTKQMTVCMPRL